MAEEGAKTRQRPADGALKRQGRLRPLHHPSEGTGEAGEKRQPGILVGDHRPIGRDRPFDADRRIGEVQSGIARRRIISVALIGDLGVRLEGAETMGKTARHEETVAVLGGERGGDPATIGRRALAEIDGNVENGAAHDAHELGLGGRWGLEMEAADRADLTRERLIILHEGNVQASFRQHGRTERLHEVAPRVLEPARLEEENVGDGETLDGDAHLAVAPAGAEEAKRTGKEADLGASPSDVTIVLVTYNSAGIVANALDSLPPESRVICVDNGSRDGTLEVLRRYPVEIVEGENVGYGSACNRAAALARSSLIIIMNPDVALEPGAMAALLAASDRYPDGAVFLPVVEDGDGRVTLRDQSRIESWGQRRRSRRLVLPAGDCCTRFADGAIFMIRRAAFERVRGFDPAIFLYYEDDDLSFRLVGSGMPIILVRDARARHMVSQSSPVTLGGLARRNAAKKVSEYYVRAKHGRPRAKLADALAQVGRMAGSAVRLSPRGVAEAWGRLSAILGMMRRG